MKLILIYHSKNLRALKYFAKSTFPVLYQRNNKAWMSVYLFTTWFTKYSKPIVETYYSEKKILFKILLLTDNAPGQSRAPIEMYNEINVVFMSPNNIHFYPMNQGIISTFKFYNLRNTFH